jgi:hypothetical protein
MEEGSNAATFVWGEVGSLNGATATQAHSSEDSLTQNQYFYGSMLRIGFEGSHGFARP